MTDKRLEAAVSDALAEVEKMLKEVGLPALRTFGPYSAGNHRIIRAALAAADAVTSPSPPSVVDPPITARMLADVLGCMWNAAIGTAHERQSGMDMASEVRPRNQLYVDYPPTCWVWSPKPQENRMSQHPQIWAEMVLDSVSSTGVRLSTMHVHCPRIILAEINTHRRFTRNARSTRAVPTARLIEEVRTNPFMPAKWMKNRPGMQASEWMSPEEIELAQGFWLSAAREAANHAQLLFDLGLHKQWAGRLLEPFMWVDVLISSTDFANFMALRDDSAAQPEMEMLAQEMRDCLDLSTPVELSEGEWHLPYVTAEEAHRLGIPVAQKVSTARCARISYSPFDGDASLDSEVARYGKLVNSMPVHASPAEHQASPDPYNLRPELHGNFLGWIQARKLLSSETVVKMPPRRRPLPGHQTVEASR